MPNGILPDGFHKDVQLFIGQDLFLFVAEFWRRDIVHRIFGDETCLLRRFQNAVEDGVDAAHGTAGQIFTQLVI